MKILFIYPNITRQTTPQIGIASLLSIISQKHQVLFFDLTIIPMGQEIPLFISALRDYKPDFVLISCRSNEWGIVRRFLEISYPIPTIIGGIHPTICPEEVLQYSKIIVRGEAEETLSEVLECLEGDRDIRQIENVWIKERGQIRQNHLRPLIQDLDKLPYPEWKFFDKNHFYFSYIKSLFPWIECVGTFETSRGCPYSCTYCCNAYLQELYKGLGNYHRKKSPQRIVEEIKRFKELYPECNFIYFVDETFMIDEDWLREFNRLYDKTPFVFMTRPEMITREKMQLIADSGGKAVSIGVENGNEKFRKEVLNRRTTQQQIIQAFKIAKDYNLHTYSFNMVGLPYETADDILATIRLNKRIKPDKAQFTIFFPFRGTKLYEVCQREGYIKEKLPDLFSYYGKSFLDLPNFKKGELEEWAKRAERECNIKGRQND